MKLHLVAATLIALSPGAQVKQQQEFGFLVTFPKGPLCDSLSGNHHHGWALPLYGDCEGASRELTILANYNAAFYATAQAAAHCEGNDLRKGAQLGLRFPKRRSVTCLTQNFDGSVLVAVVTQAGHWPNVNPDDSSDFHTPWINYCAYLRTDATHVNADVRTLKQVLASVQIAPPRQ